LLDLVGFGGAAHPGPMATLEYAGDIGPPELARTETQS
jgi:hypothetical protein